ncbi:MAG: TetR/AcrR family transcriptional regulator [Alphaproteobacteria bacterium]
MKSSRLPTDFRSPAKEAKYQQRYGEMLDAAAAVFADKGYHGASTKDIADRLGIRQGSLYYYFSSKETALEEVCTIGVEGFVQRLTEIMASPGSHADKVRQGIAAHLLPLRDRRDYTLVFLKERRNLPPASYQRISRLSRQYEQHWEDLLRAGIDAGAFRRGLNCRLAVLGMLGMVNGAPEWQRKEPDVSVEAIVEEFVAIFLDGIRGSVL